MAVAIMMSSAQASLGLAQSALPKRSCKWSSGFAGRFLGSALRPATRPLRRSNPGMVAAMAPEALLAVTQQSLLFAAVSVGETYLSRQALFEDSPGRPDWVYTGAGVGGIAVAVALVQAEGPLQQVGLVLGTAVTATLLVRSGKRVAATPDDPSDWPGPKVWPATASLLSFFAVCIFGQGLVNSLGAIL